MLQLILNCTTDLLAAVCAAVDPLAVDPAQPAEGQPVQVLPSYCTPCTQHAQQRAATSQADPHEQALAAAPFWCYLYSHDPARAKKTPPRDRAAMLELYR